MASVVEMTPAPRCVRTRLRALLAACTVLATVAALAGLATSPASAADPQARLRTVRSQIDRLAGDYFGARQRLATLDAELVSLRTRRASTERRYATQHRFAVRRAVALYTASSIVETDARSALDAARRNVLIEHAAQITNAAMARYAATRQSLIATQRTITAQRQAQKALVNSLAAQTRSLNRELASAQVAYQSLLAARAAAAAAAAHKTATTKPAVGASVTTPTTSPSSAPPNRPVATPPPPAPPGTNPHHGDAFLSCVRQRESHGFYGAVNPGGYYGAYQFAPTTWNITASHAGRPNLIGVRPDRAAPWDQDELAWTLYQWQGPGPWGGHCP